jgi:hypothetical protein
VTVYPIAYGGSRAVSKVAGYEMTVYATLIPGWVEDETYHPSVLMDDLVDPDDPNQRPISLVWFIIDIRHADVAAAFLRYTFPFQNLALPPRMEIIGGFDPSISESDLITIIKGRRMYEEFKRAGGRPPNTGRYRSEEDCVFLADVERILANYERNGMRFKNTKMFADMMGMGKTALYEMFDRVPEAHERLKRHLQKPQDRS